MNRPRRRPGRLAASLAAAALLLPGVSVVAGAEPAAGAPTRLAALSWMVGHWAGEADGVRSEEWWTPAAGGVMLGLHRDVGGGGDAFFEYLRIIERDGDLVFVAQPMGRSPVEFLMVSLADEGAVFENSGHDFPQRIVYSREGGDGLVARIEGEVEGETRSSQWRWSRVE